MLASAAARISDRWDNIMSAEMKPTEAVSPPADTTIVVSSVIFVGNSILIGIDKEFVSALLEHISSSDRRKLEKTLRSSINDALCDAMDEIAQEHDKMKHQRVKEDRLRRVGDVTLKTYAASR